MKTQKVHSILIAFFLLIAQQVFSQAPEIEWQNTIGGNHIDHLSSIQQTVDGGYILGGYSNSSISGDKTENSLPVFDYWIVKLNSAGDIEWQNTIGGNNNSYLACVQQTPDGGYIIGGYSLSGKDRDKKHKAIGGYDLWILKLNSTGDIEWQKTIGGTSDDLLHSIEPTPDGGYIVGAFSESGISGDKTEASKGESDYWILKLNSNGGIQWQKTIGGNSFDYVNALEQTLDGGYLIGGNSSSGVSGDKTEPLLGSLDEWIVKLNSLGDIEWENTIGGNGTDGLASVQQTADGGYIIGGSSDSDISGDKTENSLGGNDYWVIKLTSTGNIEWQNTLGGNMEDGLTSIQQTSDSGYIIGGSSESGVSGDKTEASFGDFSFWVLKLNNTGSIEWQNTIGGASIGFYSNGDFLTSIRQTSDNGYVIGGTSDTYAYNDKTENPEGETDYWVVKLSPQMEVCSIPLEQFTTNITSSAAKTNWNILDAANKYKVRYREAGTSTWTTVSASNNYKKLKELISSTQYDWQVKSICNTAGLGTSDWSLTQNFTTLSLKPADELLVSSSFDVYPNPASGFVTIQFTLATSSDAELSLLDLQGRKIKTLAEGNFDPGTPGGNHTLNFSVEDLPRGIYLLQLNIAASMSYQKLIVQ